MSRSIAPVLILPMLAAATPAAAIDFTFDVPVTLQRMPAARQLQVLCAVYDTIDGTGDGRNTIGSWSSLRVDVAGGNFSDSVRVEFNAQSTRGPSEARSYSCNLVVFGVDASGAPFEAGGAVFISTWRARTDQTVTLDPPRVTGPILW